jgi:uncharacterized membrane protein YhhN
MPVSYVFLAIFCLSAAFHLFCCWRGKPKSGYTKPLLVSSLALWYAFAAPEPSWMLIAALAASWLGDVLLMPKGNKWFVAGGVSFLLSHVLFLFVYLPYIRWDRVQWWIAALAGAAYAAVSAAVMRSIWGKTPKAMRVPMFLYLAANSTMNIFALMMLLSFPQHKGPALAMIGAVMFFTSDCVLFISRYHEKADRIPKRGFIIMLTYIAGEALITAGILTIQNGLLYGIGG